ncbi:MAG TPA: hypothetical protein VHL11_24715, partial [Phototrophicaceae bacterium]|nr:hypothetical protein [Phototrophicaceae bacterium]
MTGQVAEHLILDGTRMSMAYCPRFPLDHPHIVELTMEEVSAGIKAGEINGFVHSTACWRRYIGTWELKDVKFYLISLDGHFKVTSP